MINNKICAIIVTFNPDFDVLNQLLLSLSPQVKQIVIVDNTATDNLSHWITQYHSTKSIHVINPGCNIGLGAAHNRGIGWALAQRFDYALLFDQDSIPAANMVEELFKAHHALSQLGQPVAAVGPNYFDVYTGQAVLHTKIEGWRLNKSKCNNRPWLTVSILITSGSLISLDTLQTIGMLDEELFIDLVDIEWCLRAHYKSYNCFVISSAIMQHSLGDSVLRVAGRSFHHHSALRRYYLFRNPLLLFRRSYIPLIWKLDHGYKLIIRLSVYTLLMPNRWQGFKMAMQGIWDGLLGKTGKYE